MSGIRDVRTADRGDLPLVAQLLHNFNTEFDEPSPGPALLLQRLTEIIAADTQVLTIGRPPHGLAVLRFRLALWSPGLECHLAELYVAPQYRGRGDGGALLDAALDTARRRGADTMDLGTAEDDTAARALYASRGFRQTDQPGDGPVNLWYEREL